MLLLVEGDDYMFENKSVKEINEIISNVKEDEYLRYIEALKNDNRKSVQNILTNEL